MAIRPFSRKKKVLFLLDVDLSASGKDGKPDREDIAGVFGFTLFDIDLKWKGNNSDEIVFFLSLDP
jgi:hypothetical protein